MKNIVSKIKLFFLVGFLGLVPCLSSSEKIELLLFAKATEEAQLGNYEHALEIYNQIEASEQSAEFFYNKGLCLQQLKRNAEALSAFFKAEKKASLLFLSKINNQIEFILDETNQKKDSLFYQISIYGERCAPLVLLQLLFLFLWIFIWIILTGFIEIKNYIRNLLIVMLFIIGFLLVNRWWFSVNARGIILQEETSLFVGPCVDFQIIKQLSPAQKVIILQEKEEWCKIKVEDVVGWVQAQSVDSV